MTEQAQPARPTLGWIVGYRGKLGYQAPRAAIVTGTVDSLDPRGVESGAVPALDSDQHVHLWVFTPGDKGGFPEYNVGPGDGPGEWSWLAPGEAWIRVADLARIDVRPGDVIVYRPREPLSDQQVDELTVQWEQVMPGVPLLVAADGEFFTLRGVPPAADV